MDHTLPSPILQLCGITILGRLTHSPLFDQSLLWLRRGWATAASYLSVPAFVRLRVLVRLTLTLI